MTVVMAIRSMARSGYPSFQEGGLGPYLDLTAVDPNGMLPLTSVGLAFVFLQVYEDLFFLSFGGLPLLIGGFVVLLRFSFDQQYTYGRAPLLAFRVIKWGLQGLLLFSLPVSYLLPAGAHFYWIDATLLGFTQVALLRNARFRRVMGLPELLKKA